MLKPPDDTDDAIHRLAESRQLGQGGAVRLLTRHSANLGLDLWPTDLAPSGLPMPEELKALLVPADYGVRLDDKKGGMPVPPDSG